MARKLSTGIASLEAAKQKLRDEQIPRMNDKSLSLDERWAIFTELAGAGVLPHELYGDGYLDELQGTGHEMTQYDDFYNDRGATVSFVDMYEAVIENPEDFEGADIDGWREYVIGKGFGTFDYDW